MTAENFEILADPARCLLRITFRGYWDLPAVQAYKAALLRAGRQLLAAGCSRSRMVALVDARAGGAQSQDVIASYKDNFGSEDMAVRRVATLVTSALFKRQVERVAIANHRLFTDLNAEPLCARASSAHLLSGSAISAGFRACVRPVRRGRRALAIWHDSRDRASRCSASSSMSFSCSPGPPTAASHSGDTSTWQVAHAHMPPQSPLMPGTPVPTAPSITDTPSSTSTMCCVPSCST